MLRTPYGGLGALFVVCCLLLAGCGKEPSTSAGDAAETTPSAPPGNATVRIAAAADLRFALEEVAAEFNKTKPDVKVTATYGSSGNLSTQIANGAPFDVFLSADRSYAHRLVEQGIAAADSEFVYAIGQLALWVPSTSTLDLDKLGIKAVVDPSVRKVAIANPGHAPYGRAAEAAFRSFGVYDLVRERLVLGENVAQAAQFAESGAADVGVIPLPLAMAPAMQHKGRHWVVPCEAFPRLDQTGVVLRSAADPDAAKRFCQFLSSQRCREILARFGFLSPEE
ncbi:MAG: molybdate ABC transporter substrate-binding protein [Pirellulales bacterium]|nr:molybdate ABC transporter substrate-binding protein [Pirellulales bacterium]